jgi:hypothetical protein
MGSPVVINSTLGSHIIVGDAETIGIAERGFFAPRFLLPLPSTTRSYSVCTLQDIKSLKRVVMVSCCRLGRTSRVGVKISGLGKGVYVLTSLLATPTL